MRKLRLLFVVLAALAVPTAAFASPVLNKTDISSSQCGHQTGKNLLVDVTYTLVNDYDSGYAGNAWANDTINRQLRIWQTKDATPTYCAQVRDTGGFSTFAGASPSGKSTVSAGVTGTLKGGYVTSFFTGTYAPTYATRGDLGTFDLQCTDASNCPGVYPSYKSYFSSTSGDSLAQWGWIYRAPHHHGTWLNQDDTTADTGGDITG